MIKKYTHNDITWVDVSAPNENEVREVMDTYDIYPLIAEELISPSMKPKIELFDDSIYLILHFPVSQHTHADRSYQEIDFILTDKTLVTVRYDTIDAVHKFSKEFEMSTTLDDDKLGDDAGIVFLFLLSKLYKSIEHELEFITSRLEEIEVKVFAGHEKAMVREISNVSRTVLDFKGSLRRHEALLAELKIALENNLGKQHGRMLTPIMHKFHNINSLLEQFNEQIFELRETNNSLLSTKQNEVMKTLTIMAFVTFPLSLLASIFGMNTATLPVVGHPLDFWIITGLMAILMIIFFSFFKYKRWL